MKKGARCEGMLCHRRMLPALALCSASVFLAVASWAGGRHLPGASTTAAGARIYVTTTTQKIGGTGSGGCSLQEAIYSSVLHNSLDGTHGIAVDSTDPDHFITTDCVAGTGNGDTIVLPTNGYFSLTDLVEGDAHNAYGPTATPLIFSNMTIEGHGATLQWTGGSSKNVRLFTVGSASIAIHQDSLNTTASGTGNLTLRNVYVKAFHVKGGDGADGGGGGLGAGGAIYVQSGTLVVENSTFDSNRAVGGNDINTTNAGGGGGGLGGNGGKSSPFSSGGGGGGARGNGGNGPFGGGGGGGTIFAGANGDTDTGAAGGYVCGGNGGDQSDNGNDGHDGSCPGGGGGGGGYDRNPINPLVSIKGGNGNYGGGGGGGPDNGGNGGFGGGGGSSSNGHQDGNGGFGGGGGAFNGIAGAFGGNGNAGGNGGGALGGAIFSDGGSVTIRNSTFYNNSVSRGPGGGDAGGAIFSHNGVLAILNATVANNQSTGSGGGVVMYGDSGTSTFVLENTIVANNGANECYTAGGATVALSGVGNLIMQNGSGNVGACPGVVTSVDPSLGPLQNNTGLTPTMAIPLFSSAMGTADSSTSLPSDQKYADRPQPDKAPRNGYDIGGYEICRRFQGPSLVLGPCSETHISPPPTTTLTMQSAVPAGTTNPVAGTYTVDVNSVLPITATPNWTYVFKRWIGGNLGDYSNPSTTVIMDQAWSVQPLFVTLYLTNVSETNGHITLTVQAAGDSRGDYVYRLERTTSLMPANWQSIPGVNDLQPGRTGSYQMTDTTNPIGPSSAFYRIRVLP